LLIEFKFCSIDDGQFFHYNQVQGLFWVPLLQDQDLGVFSIPEGKNHLMGTLHEREMFLEFTRVVKCDTNRDSFLTFDLTIADYSSLLIREIKVEVRKLHTGVTKS
jgi:hypothetical protein